MSEYPSSERDAARTTGLADATQAVLPALEAFLRFEGSDPAAQLEAWRPLLDEPLPARGHGADEVLRVLAEVVVPHGLRIGAPGFSGWVTTMPPVVPAVSTLAASISAAQRWWLTPGNFLEELALRWLAELVGLPATFGGSFVSGGSVANLLGLAAARQYAGEQRGFDPAADGVAGFREPRVYAGHNVHHVVLRALGTLGFGRRALQRVGSDRNGLPDLTEMRRLIADDVAAGRTPIAVVASAGDVNTGLVDPIDELRAIADEHAMWLHVDGAYGGFGVLDPRVRDLYGDLTRIDSLAIDPHKWMAVPVGCGAALVRDTELLERALALEPADYVEHKRDRGAVIRSPFEQTGEGSADRSIDHSAPSRGLLVWSVLKEIGVDGMRARVARHLDCARRVAERVRAHDDLELLAEPVLSICCFRYHPPAIRDQGTIERLNRAILAEVLARGRCVPSSTRVRNRFGLRPCFIGPRATLADADALVDEVLAAAAIVAQRKQP